MPNSSFSSCCLKNNSQNAIHPQKSFQMVAGAPAFLSIIILQHWFCFVSRLTLKNYRQQHHKNNKLSFLWGNTVSDIKTKGQFSFHVHTLDLMHEVVQV